MPIREYRCTRCGKVQEFITGFDQFPKSAKCSCGARARYQFRPTRAFAFNFTFKYGWDPGAGKYFDSKRQRDTYLDRKNLRRVEDGVSKERDRSWKNAS